MNYTALMNYTAVIIMNLIMIIIFQIDVRLLSNYLFFKSRV